MKELTLQPGVEDPPFPCDDCGGATRVARGGVREDGRDHAIYLAATTAGHRPIALSVSLGRFGQGTTPADRILVSMLAQLSDDEGFEAMVVDPDRSPIVCDAVLGRQLGREQALAHPDLQEVFRVVQLVVIVDARVNEWLAATGVH